MAKKMKTCHNCRKQFERRDEYVVDTGDDFCCVFQYECPYCKAICKTDKDMKENKDE